MVYKHFDNCLFRYRKMSDERQAEKNICALEENKLYFSTPANFNDPYDSLLYVNDGELFGDIQYNWEIGMDSYLNRLEKENPIIAAFGKMIWYGENRQKNIDSFKEMLDQKVDKVKTNIRNYVKIICFTEDCLSMLMWSHYASDHEGFVLVYNKDELLNAHCFDSKDNRIPRKLCLKPINYSNTRINMTKYIHEHLLKYELPSLMDVTKLPDIPSIKVREFILNKMKEWDYEKEWRLIPRVINIQEENPMCYIQLLPKAIIIGAKCTINNERKLREIAQRKEIAIFKVRIADSVDYGLVLENIN